MNISDHEPEWDSSSPTPKRLPRSIPQTPNPEVTLRTVLEAYKRVYQVNRGKYLSIAEMRDAIKDELHRNTNYYIRYPDDPQPALEETLAEIPEFIQMVVTHNVGVCIIESFKITEEQLQDIRQQIEQADLPLGLAIALNGPVPIWKQVDVDLPFWRDRSWKLFRGLRNNLCFTDQTT